MRAMRNRKILELVRGLLLSEVAFREILKKYRKGRLRFSDVANWVDDRGQSLLYNVKEQCHGLFRHIGMDPSHRKEWLLDLAIGSIFHEAMKLRESIYQLEFYRPKYLQYKLKTGASGYEKDYHQQFEKIMSKAESGVTEGMEETLSLFRDATAQLIDFFKERNQDPYFVRFLLEHQSLLHQVYGARGTREVFHLLFGKGVLDAYVLAGRSYLEGEHYDLSSLYFSKALKTEPRSLSLRFLLNFSLGMNAYYRNDYTKALNCFAKLIHLEIDAKLKREYMKKADEICLKICSELKEEKGLRAFARCRSVADQIRKMLSYTIAKKEP